MPLLCLPIELQLRVLGLVGSGFFHEDTSRLTISMQWHAVASQVLFRDLRLTVRSLMRLAENETALARCQAHTRTVGILLEDFEGLVTTVLSDPGALAAQVNESLLRLAATLQQCRGLNSLELKARPYEVQEPESLSRLQYLMPTPLSQLLAVQNLTSLRLDIAGAQSPKAVPDEHICASINGLLPKLRRLHCRMETICTSLLDLSSIDETAGVEEVIINLSLSNLTETWTAYRYPKRCRTRQEGVLELQDDIEGQAAELASRLDTARRIRVISHKLPSLEWEAFDAVQGRRVRLEAGSEWDADGETVEETGSEDGTDLFESELDSPPQITL